MNRKVFILDKGEMGVLEEKEYKEIEIMDATNELALQKCLENFPELIPASQIDVDNPPLFLAVKAEAGVTLGSIDILMLDSNGILNIVETKLYQNKDIRRAVIGQALEYASHLVMEWDVDKVKDEGYHYWQAKNANFDDLITDKLNVSEEKKEEFWNKVSDNLEKMKVRILIVADIIPKELRRVVEFVNRNSNFEFLALEIKLFADKKTGRKVLVPSIIGASVKKTPIPSAPKWTIPDIEKAMQSEGNETRKKRFLEMLKFCSEIKAFDEAISKNPSFIVRNIDENQLMTFIGNGTVYVQFQKDRFEKEGDLDIFFNKINSLRIFDYKKARDYGHGRNSKGKIEDLTDAEFEELKTIIKRAYNKKIS